MTRRKRVLVVDDDPLIRQMYRTALSLFGFDVDVVEDGLAALYHIEQELPDLIVLDLNLPMVNGQAVLEEIRAHPETSSLPVVVVTGTDYHHALAQATAILHKPLDPAELITVISRHVRPAA